MGADFQSSESPNRENELLTVQQIAEEFNYDPQTIYHFGIREGTPKPVPVDNIEAGKRKPRLFRRGDIENYLKEKPHRHPHADSLRNRKKRNLALPDPQVRATIIRQYQEEQKKLEEIKRMAEQAEKRVLALEQAIAVYTPDVPEENNEKAE